MSARNLSKLLVLIAAPAFAVALSRAEAPGADGAFEPPRTPWGDPDLQGVWDYRTITPLQRPAQYGDREFYTDEEIAQLEGRAEAKMDKPPDENTPANLVHAQYMTDPGTKVDESRRTSLIVDPPSGHMPERVDGQERGGFRMGGRGVQHPEQPWLDRSLLERCISRGMPAAILPGLYNNNIQIVQSPGVVAIIHEMVHETRLIPLDDDSAPTGLKSYMGESRGHWEGDTLVVESTGFNDDVGYGGASENLRLTERYTLISPDRIDFKMTFEDPTTWVQPWTVEYLMRPTDGQIYEYACHEGNYGLRNILENLVDSGQAGAAAANVGE